MSFAISSVASAILFATLPENSYALDGLPYSSVKKGFMVSKTSGKTLVVAALSKYILFSI